MDAGAVKAWTILCLFAWWFGVLLSAPVLIRAEQLPIKIYTTADGLARDQINRIVRDSRGFLWFCTHEGLSRFDGYTFTNYTMDHGLPHRSIRGVLETRSGTYWVATGDGLCQFNPKPVPGQARGPAPSSVPGPRSLAKTKTKDQGLRTKDQSLFIVYHPSQDPAARSITALYEDRAGTVWIGTHSGLYRLEQTGDRVSFHFVEMGMPKETGDDRLVEGILEDRRGALWVGTRGSGLYRRWPDGRTERYTTQQGLPINRMNALLEDRDGRLWVGASEGLCLLNLESQISDVAFRYDKSAIRHPPSAIRHPVVVRVYTKKDFGLASDWVNALFQSSDGRIWLGTAGGLSELLPAASEHDYTFRSYTKAHGLSDWEIEALAEDRDGNLWMGTASGGVMKLARGGFTTYTHAGDFGDAGVFSILEDRDGALCTLTKDRSGRMLIHRFDGKRFIAIRPHFPKRITYFGWGWNHIGLQDRAREWWVATGQGLCRFPTVSRIEHLATTPPKAVYTTRDGLIADEVWRLFEDSRGDIWIGTISSLQSGLSRWERATETFHRYSDKDGLPSSFWAHAFCEDRSGNVWIGVNGDLARYAAGRFTLFTAADGVPAGGIQGLYVDRAGRLWIGSDAGGLGRVDDPTTARPHVITYTTADGLSSNQVFCITEDQWGRIYIGTGRGLDRLDPMTGQVKHYTAADGLGAGGIVGAFRDRHGALWFRTAHGLSRLVPQPEPPRPPPPILISGLRIAGHLHPVSELGESDVSRLTLGPNENQIQIDFIGLSFGTGEALRYQYKLEGADPDWHPLTDQRPVHYASLSPGTYRFVVQAVGADGLTSPAPATVSFTILPPIWQRWWFFMLAAMAIGFVMYTIHRYRVARLLELERVRTRIATDLHDDIGSSLSRMAILSEVVKQQNASANAQSVEMLTQISDTARNLVDTMSDIVWSIDPRRDDLNNLVLRIAEFAADVLDAKGIAWTFQTPPNSESVKLTPDQRRHVFLIFKEAITNIARHAESASVSLAMSVADHHLKAEIRDDGRGFVVEAASSATKSPHQGHGLKNMHARTAELGGQLSIDSAPGRGTRLALTIPLK